MLARILTVPLQKVKCAWLCVNMTWCTICITNLLNNVGDNFVHVVDVLSTVYCTPRTANPTNKLILGLWLYFLSDKTLEAHAKYFGWEIQQEWTTIMILDELLSMLWTMFWIIVYLGIPPWWMAIEFCPESAQTVENLTFLWIHTLLLGLKYWFLPKMWLLVCFLGAPLSFCNGNNDTWM